MKTYRFEVQCPNVTALIIKEYIESLKVVQGTKVKLSEVVKDEV